MKANELMIGDWVRVEAHRGFDAQNVRVETIPDASSDSHFGHIGTFLIGGDEDFRDVEDWHLSPIPLTPEILEKNGFNYIVTKGEVAPKIDGFELDNHWVGDGFSWNGVRITYVHELQHALKLCGINKEIVL